MVWPSVITVWGQWEAGETEVWGRTSITVPWAMAEPMRRGCRREEVPAEGWGRMEAVVLIPALVVWTAPGMKAEIMPDWLLTGNIWQMIGGLATGGEDNRGVAVGGLWCGGLMAGMGVWLSLQSPL